MTSPSDNNEPFGQRSKSLHCHFKWGNLISRWEWKKWSLDFCFYHCQLTMFLIQQTNKKNFYLTIKTFYLHLCTVCTIVPISHLQYCLKVLSHLLILYIWFSGSFSLDTGCVFIHFESSTCSWQQGNPCCVYTKTGS